MKLIRIVFLILPLLAWSAEGALQILTDNNINNCCSDDAEKEESKSSTGEDEIFICTKTTVSQTVPNSTGRLDLLMQPNYNWPYFEISSPPPENI